MASEDQVQEDMKTLLETPPPETWTDRIHQVEVVEFSPIQWDPRLGFDKVAEALAQAQGEFEPITLDKVGKISWDKNGKSGSFSYKYASLGNIIRCVAAPLSKFKIARMQGVHQTGKGVIEIGTMLVVGSQWMGSSLILQTGAADPKAVGSIISYGRRYTLSNILSISAEEDDDGDVAMRGMPSGKAPTSPHQRGRGTQDGDPAADKAKAIRVITSAETWPQLEDAAAFMEKEIPKVIRRDPEVVSKYTAKRLSIAGYEIRQAKTAEQLTERWARYPASVKEEPDITEAYADMTALFDADKVNDQADNENQEPKEY